MVVLRVILHMSKAICTDPKSSDVYTVLAFNYYLFVKGRTLKVYLILSYVASHNLTNCMHISKIQTKNINYFDLNTLYV